MMSHSFVGFGAMAGLAGIGHLLLLSGVVLLLAWAIKHLHGEKLRQAALWCIAGGIVLWVLSFAFAGIGGQNMKWKIRSGDKTMMFDENGEVGGMMDIR